MTQEELRMKRILPSILEQFNSGDAELVLSLLADIEYRVCLLELGVG